MPSIGVHVECHDPKGLRERHYQFHDRHLPSQKYVSLFTELQRRLEQDVSADTGVKIHVQSNPGPGPGFPSSCSSPGKLKFTEDGWFLHKSRHQQGGLAHPRVRYPRLGAFEVVVVHPEGLGPLSTHFKAFSKIGTGKWPRVDALCNRLKQVLDAAQSGDAQEVGRIVQRMQQISEGQAGAGDAAGGMDSTRCTTLASTSPQGPPFLSRASAAARHPGSSTPAARGALRPAARAPVPPRSPAGAGFASFPSPARPSTAGTMRPAGPHSARARPHSAAEPRAPPARGPDSKLLQLESLTGYWCSDNPRDNILVEGGKVKWASRPGLQAWTLKAFSHDRVILTGPSDEKYKGTLMGTPKDGSLVWDDGDVWMRHDQAGRTSRRGTPRTPRVAEQASITGEALDSTAIATEDLLDQQGQELMAEVAGLAMDAPGGEAPVLKDLVGRLVRKHGESARPHGIISRLRKLPPLEEQLSKSGFKEPLYSLGVMTDEPLNLNGLFAELSRGSPPACSMLMLIEALDDRWPVVDPLPSASGGGGGGSEYSGEFDSSGSAASAHPEGERGAGQRPRAGPAPAAGGPPAPQDSQEDAYSDSGFETEEPSATLPAGRPPASQAPATRAGDDESEYGDGDFEDDGPGHGKGSDDGGRGPGAAPAVPDESDEDVLEESLGDVVDETLDDDVLNESGDVVDETLDDDVLDESGDERGRPPLRAAGAAPPPRGSPATASDGTVSEGSEVVSEVESVASAG